MPGLSRIQITRHLVIGRHVRDSLWAIIYCIFPSLSTFVNVQTAKHYNELSRSRRNWCRSEHLSMHGGQETYSRVDYQRLKDMLHFHTSSIVQIPQIKLSLMTVIGFVSAGAVECAKLL
jgi:hypothetical protein